MEFKLVNTISENELESYLDEEFGEGSLDLEEILVDLAMYGESIIDNGEGYAIKIETSYSQNEGYDIYESI